MCSTVARGTGQARGRAEAGVSHVAFDTIMSYAISFTVARADKLLQKLLRFPAEMRYSEVKRVLEAYGYRETQSSSGSSHYVFKKTGVPPVTLSKKHGRTIKRYQLKDIAAALELEN